jgi:hypothetical protein
LRLKKNELVQFKPCLLTLLGLQEAEVIMNMIKTHKEKYGPGPDNHVLPSESHCNIFLACLDVTIQPESAAVLRRKWQQYMQQYHTDHEPYLRQILADLMATPGLADIFSRHAVFKVLYHGSSRFVNIRVVVLHVVESYFVCHFRRRLMRV